MSEKIHGLMIEISREVDPIEKKQGNNDKIKYKFRGIDDCYNALHYLMAKKGVYSTPKVLEYKREERATASGGVLFYTTALITYTFRAEDGSSVECTVLGEGMDSGDKASNKAMSVAHKYALIQCFSIPTENMIDPDKENYPDVRPKPGVSVEPHTLAYSPINIDPKRIPTMSQTQPSEEDGIFTDNENIINYGEWARMSYEECVRKKGIPKVKDRIAFLINSAEKRGETISGTKLEFIEKMTVYLASLNSERP